MNSRHAKIARIITRDELNKEELRAWVPEFCSLGMPDS